MFVNALLSTVGMGAWSRRFLWVLFLRPYVQWYFRDASATTTATTTTLLAAHCTCDADDTDADSQHLFRDRSQYMPAAVSQSTLPHAQADGLGAEPSVAAHATGREQMLDAAMQIMPVPCPSPFILVHAAFPQMQGAALLGADPSVFVQAGAVRVHMHVCKLSHPFVDQVHELKYTLPEVVL